MIAPSSVLDLALPPADLDLTIDPDDVVLTAHAVQRYRERVERISRRLTERRLRDLISIAQWRVRPRQWTKVVLYPGVVYGYGRERPDVCLVLRQQALVTVLSRRFLQQQAVSWIDVPSPRRPRTIGGRLR